ncbi:hypothetical protein Tco_0025387 [Tanacetum coccineum]
MPVEGEKNINQATISQLFQRRAKKVNLNRPQPETTTPPPIPPVITTTTSQEDKGKKALSLEEAKKESTESGSDDKTTHMPSSMVESSKKKELEKFDFVTESGEHVHLTKKHINEQKKIEEEVKAEAARRKASRITNYDVLIRKGLITLKVYREDGTNEIIPNFKASDLHLGEWREVMKACPKRTRKRWEIIYKQIGTRMDYINITEAELGINLEIPLSKQDPLDKLNDIANKKRKHAEDIYDYFKANKRLKSPVQYEDHLPGTVLNEPVLGLDDHARTFSSLLLAEIDKRNLNPLKKMRVIEHLSASVVEVPSASALQVLRRLGSIFTSVYEVKLKRIVSLLEAYVDSKTITQADGAQSSRVLVPLPDDPYVAVRQAQLVDTDIELDPEEAPSEAEESQPLGSRLPLMSEEFEAFEPSGTRTISSHSPVSSNSTASLSPDHPLTHVSPTPTPTQVSFHQAMTLLDTAFCKRYRSSYETPSLSSSSTLPVRKRYQGTSELILDTESEGDKLGDEDTKEDVDEESQGLDNESHGLDDESQSLDDETTSKPLGLGYGATRHRALKSTKEIAPSTYEVGQSTRVYTDILTYAPPVAPVQTPPSPEWSLGSLPVSPSSLVVPSPIALPVATLAATISRLDTLPPTLVTDIDRDVRELCTRSGHIDNRMANMSRARYDDHRLIQDMLVQQAAMQRELQEMRGLVTTLDQERGRKEP